MGPVSSPDDEIFDPRDLPRPPGLQLKKKVAPGVEQITLGGLIGKAQLRIERDHLVFRRLVGSEQRTSLEEIMGFVARQHITLSDEASASSSNVTWHVGAVTSKGAMLRLWEYRDRDAALYLASELNRSLSFIRSREVSAANP